jgi:putative membrane protein
MLSALSSSVAGSLAAPAAAAHWMGPWAGGFFPFFLLIPIFWIIVIGLIVFFVARRRRAFWRDHAEYDASSASRNAEATLAERFAQGDIDEVEYRKRLEVLRANRPGPGPR